MRDPELVRGRALRGYEWDRFRWASRVAAVLLPVIAVCLAVTEKQEACACLALLLLAGSVFLRWRNRQGAQTVAQGIVAGSAPLAAALWISIDPGALGATHVLWLLGASGAVAALLVRYLRRGERGGPGALAIALLTASLTCVSLGPAALGAVAGGLAIGFGASALLRPAR